MINSTEIESDVGDDGAWNDNNLNLNFPVLDHLLGDGVNISCVNSTDFVVGKQTNFNGPVTIINCERPRKPDGHDKSSPEISKEGRKEEIVIRNKILSDSATEVIHQIAEKKCVERKSAAKTVEKSFNANKWLLKNSCKVSKFFWLGFLGILILAATVTAILVLTKPENSDKILERCQPRSKTDNINICIYDDYVREVDSSERIPMSSPVPYVIISQTNSEFCFNYVTCVETIKTFKSDGFYEDNSTLCSFFIGGDGRIFLDAGWNVSTALSGPTAGKSIDICLIGNSVDYPTYPQIQSTKSLIRFGSVNNYIAKNYILMGSNATETPHRILSPSLYKIIKKWPKFSESPFLIDEDDALKEDFPIVSKKDWGGKPATSFIEMKLPVPYVVISHSVTVTCSNFDSCSSLLRNVQSYHQSLNFADIAYNFMVDSNGWIYEGRGWSMRNVAGGFINGRNLNINFIGDFSQSGVPTVKQLAGVKYLIRQGVKNGKIALDYSLIADNATFDTLSPGKNVYAIIKNWTHFDADPVAHIKNYDDSPE